MARTTTIGDLRAELTLNSSKFEKGISRSRKKMDNLSKGFTLLKTAIAGLALGTVVRELAGAQIAFDRIQNSLKAATGSSEAAAREFAFVTKESERLGLSLEDTASEYAKLSAASKGTALEGQATRDIFIAVSEAAVVLGLSAEQTGGALTAIQQIISKGTVSSEELRGQLGERLPGAFQIASRAVGVTTQELGKMLQKGEVIADDFLPKFAAELTKTFSPQVAEASKTLNASINRMQTAFFLLKKTISDQFLTEFFISATNAASAFLRELTKLSGGDPFFGLSVDVLKAKIKELNDELLELEKNPFDFSSIIKPFRIEGIQSELAVLQAQLAATEALLKQDSSGPKSLISAGEAAFNASKTVEKLGENIESAEVSMDGFFDTAATIPGQIVKISEAQALLSRIFASSRTPIDDLKADLSELNARVLEGEFGFQAMQEAMTGISDVTIPEVAAAVKILKDDINEITETTKENNLELQGFFIGIGQATEDAAVRGLTETTNKLEALRELAKSIVDDIIRLIIRTQIIAPLFGAAGANGQPTSLFGNLFGFASGGQFTVGGQSGIDNNLVAFKASKGERVTVETEAQQRSGGATVVQNLNFAMGIQSTVRAEIMNMLPVINKSAKSAVVDAKRRGQLGTAF